LAFMALDREGETGGAALQEGFVYAEYAEQKNTLKTGAVYGKDFR